MRIIKRLTYIGLVWACMLAQIAGAQQRIAFTPNKGQWDSRISYQLEIPGGYFYLEKDKLTLYYLDRPHKHGTDEHEEKDPEFIKAHAVKTHFVGCNPSPVMVDETPTSYYYNYFLGKDPSRWKSNVFSYHKITYKELYPGIDYTIYDHKGMVKSDYIIKPGADHKKIKLNYEGADKITIENGELHVRTTLGEIVEEKPVAYQLDENGNKQMVAVRYKLDGTNLCFEITGKHDANKTLVIDPVLIFATYNGSTADNFGCTATYDGSKNAYTGAFVYPGGVYPTTAGAFNVTFNNGSAGNSRDIGITKFSPDGSSLVFSTFIGGTDQEEPHSLVVNSNDELYVYGTTGSSDFPVTAGAFDNTFNGGTVVGSGNLGLSYNSGCDIFVAKLNAAGSAMLGCTFVGGTGNDGLNFADSLNYNYGDILRGEIIIDGAGNCVVASTTGSADFPTVAGSFQTFFAGGMTDACVFKLNGSLTNLIWSSYYGGSRHDSGYGVQIDSNGNIFFTGGTTSSNLPMTPGVIDPSFNGLQDGYVAKVSSTGNVLLAATYLGTNNYDQSYFVQLDVSDNVYTYGQTLGAYPIIPATVYNNGNSGQFVHKMNNNLSVTVFSTRIGRNANVVDISPTAFLVNVCDQIYLSGWGGTVNHFQQAISSSTTGMPITTDAFQTTTDGSDFWLAILAPDADSLAYATFFGGPVSKEHVDGGTSRFDKNGVVYQAVCAGCGSNDDFPTTPGAWSNVNGSSNCNLGVFKFDLAQVNALADFNIILNNCQYPMEVIFENNSTGALNYFWDYGDGNTSTSYEDPHLYNQPDTYDVMLIAFDTTCGNSRDTVFLQIVLPPEPLPQISPVDTTCKDLPVTLNATGGGTYSWSPSIGLDNPFSSTPTANIDVTTQFIVTVTDTNNCVRTDTVTVYVFPDIQINAGDDVIIDIGDNKYLNATIPPNCTFYWTPAQGLSCTNCLNPLITVNETTTFYLIVTDQYGCVFTDSATVYVTSSIFIPNAFTNNGDGHNDIFYAYTKNLSFFEIYIFNRWGEVVYHSTDPEEGWNGTHKGKAAQLGVYVWKVKYADEIKPDEYIVKYGHVTLIK